MVDGFEKVTFDHDKTRFRLTGKHAGVSCSKCHGKKGAGGTEAPKPPPTACGDCHADVHLGQFARSCEACHSTQGFSGAALKFNHQADSAFPLLGKHALLSCQKCHLKTKTAFPAGPGEAVLYKPLRASCLSCHGDYHQGQLSGDCRSCHGFDAFRPAPGFDHNRSRFPLQLFHEKVSCRGCHPLSGPAAGGKTVQTVQYKNITSECRECHRTFDHNRTAFALTGVHQDLDCRKCHNAKTPNLQGTGKNRREEIQCAHCHRSPHLGQQKDCRECHSGITWRVEPW